MINFNSKLYQKLSIEDKQVIDEYFSKLTAEELNSFMLRLLDNPPEHEILEVNEELDSILVFERNNISKNTKRLPIKDILTYLDIADKILYKALKKYFDLYGTDGFWIPTSIIDVENKVKLLASDFDSRIKKIETISIPKYYTYRNGRKKFKRFGIILDDKLIPGGYTRNMSCIWSSIDSVINPKFVKVRYWNPNNAKLHGFNNKTGIIWLYDGRKESRKIELLIATEAFVKAFQRLDLRRKLHNLIINFELNAI